MLEPPWREREAGAANENTASYDARDDLRGRRGLISPFGRSTSLARGHDRGGECSDAREDEVGLDHGPREVVFGRRASQDKDRVEAGALGPGDVGNKVIADHGNVLAPGERLAGDLEHERLRLADDGSGDAGGCLDRSQDRSRRWPWPVASREDDIASGRVQLRTVHDRRSCRPQLAVVESLVAADHDRPGISRVGDREEAEAGMHQLAVQGGGADGEQFAAGKVVLCGQEAGCRGGRGHHVGSGRRDPDRGQAGRMFISRALRIVGQEQHPDAVRAQARDGTGRTLNRVAAEPHHAVEVNDQPVAGETVPRRRIGSCGPPFATVAAASQDRRQHGGVVAAAAAARFGVCEPGARRLHEAELDARGCRWHAAARPGRRRPRVAYALQYSAQPWCGLSVSMHRRTMSRAFPRPGVSAKAGHPHAPVDHSQLALRRRPVRDVSQLCSNLRTHLRESHYLSIQ